MRDVIATPAAPAAIGPYAQAIRAGGFIFTSGQIPIDPGDGALHAAAEIAAQTELVLRNLAALLEAAGSGLEKVVKTTVYMTDLGEFAAMNAVYGRFFRDAPPARSTVEVRGLPRGVRIEIEAVALA